MGRRCSAVAVHIVELQSRAFPFRRSTTSHPVGSAATRDLPATEECDFLAHQSKSQALHRFRAASERNQIVFHKLVNVQDGSLHRTHSSHF